MKLAITTYLLSIKENMMKKLAIILSDGFEEIEAVTVIDILRRSGLTVEVLGLNETVITGAHGLQLEADDKFDYFGTLDCDGIVFAGGMKNAISLSNDSEVLRLIEFYNDNKKMIAGICASPSILFTKTSILNDKNVTCYPSQELISNLKNCNYVDKCVVVCDNIITSQSPYTSMAFALSIVKYFGHDIESLQLELKGNL